VRLRVVLADDHALVREGLRSILEREADVEVVGEAATGREAVTLARTLRPDVVVMDVAMKDLNGIEATRQIGSECEGVKVVALSSHADPRYVAAMLQAGACGYVLKANAYDELRRALRAATRGQRYLAPDVTGNVIESALHPSEGAAASGLQALAAREREVLQLIAEGLSSPEIARRLHLATSTVETHRRNIMNKLGLRSVAELTRFAIREGLTPLDE
jgi:DNA-binding NarL/FixJ family response regulator